MAKYDDPGFGTDRSGYSGSYGGRNTRDSSDKDAADRAAREAAARVAESYSAGYERPGTYVGRNPEQYRDVLTGIRDTGREAGFSDVDISQTLAGLNTPYGMRAGMVGPIDAIAGTDRLSQMASRGLSALVGMTPYGTAMTLGDLIQRGVTSGPRAIHGRDLASVAGRLAGNPLVGIGAGGAWDVGKALAQGQSLGDAASAGLQGQAQNIGGLVGAQLGAQFGEGSPLGGLFGANIGNVLGRTLAGSVAGEQPTAGPEGTREGALSTVLGGLRERESRDGGTRQGAAPVVPPAAPPAIQAYINAHLGAPAQLDWLPIQRGGF